MVEIGQWLEPHGLTQQKFTCADGHGKNALLPAKLPIIKFYNRRRRKVRLMYAAPAVFAIARALPITDISRIMILA